MLQVSIANHDGLSGAFVLKLAEHGVFVASLGILLLLVFEPSTDVPEVNKLIVNEDPLQRLERYRNRVLLFGFRFI